MLDRTVEEALGPVAEREPHGCIVIGTQTSEQSLDIDADLLLTSRDHDLKQTVASRASPEDWVFALVSLQTSEGYGGRGNYGIAQMNGGSSSRPMLGRYLGKTDFLGIDDGDLRLVSRYSCLAHCQESIRDERCSRGICRVLCGQGVVPGQYSPDPRKIPEQPDAVIFERRHAATTKPP